MSGIRELEKTLVSYKYPVKAIYRPGQLVYFIKDGYRYDGMVIQYKFGRYRIQSDKLGLVTINPNHVESRLI
ncbi:hypothetical protein UGMREWDR_CDS0088 [Aeromonas phage GomatiRiver_11]|nr:hypothetical protein OBDJBBDK_00081 [Aeromonas phage AhFM11]WKW84255.1 hypothetical protein UGMREWDR_CDS0088 [Aeromonas phage GomatiRiver_11]